MLYTIVWIVYWLVVPPAAVVISVEVFVVAASVLIFSFLNFFFLFVRLNSQCAFSIKLMPWFLITIVDIYIVLTFSFSFISYNRFYVSRTAHIVCGIVYYIVVLEYLQSTSMSSLTLSSFYLHFEKRNKKSEI